MQMQCETQLSVTRSVRRVTFTRRTLVRGHGLSTNPPKTSVSVLISCEEWLDPAGDLLLFDQRLHAAEERARPGHSFLLSVCGPRTILRDVAKQVFTRYQRLFQRRNSHSRSNVFTAVLVRHRELHRSAQPVAMAEFDHALDVWQWVLRLYPDASAALQIAALFHHVALLTNGAGPGEAQEHERTSDRHDSKAKVEMLRSCLAGFQLPPDLIERAAGLIAGQELADERELDVLKSAEALSFFAVNSSAFLSHHGVDRTAVKVATMVGRMNANVREFLAGVRLDPRVQQPLLDALREEVTRDEPRLST